MNAVLKSGVLAALLGFFWWMAVSPSPRVGATADERLQLVGGYTYWKFNDYRVQPENGNLTMRVQGLPLLTMDLRFPPVEKVGFRHEDRGNELGHEFLFGSGNPFVAMLTRARAATALFSVLTLALVWGWARGLFGAGAAWLGVLAGMFCPTLLAHSGLATSDAAITACLLAAVTACWLLLHRVTAPRLAAAGMAVGAALLAKFSAMMLLPIAAILLALRWARPTPLILQFGRQTHWVRRRLQVVIVTLAVAGVTALLAIGLVWAAYGFRYSALNPQVVSADRSTGLNWDYQMRRLGPAEASFLARSIGWAREQRILPEAWLYGFTDSYTGSRSRRAFLMGEVSTTGWPQFFPIAFALKTPPTLLAMLALGVAALATAVGRQRRAARGSPWPRRGWLYRAIPLLVLFLLYWTIAINTPLNIGHRHLLPTYPVLYVVAGAAAGWLLLGSSRRLFGLLLAGTVMLHAVESWRTRPYYLSYFTPWVGGGEQGWRYLADSSSDWGQGLPALAKWIAAKEARGDHAPVFLTYFGTDSPEARKLPVTRFGDLVRDLSPRSFPAQVRGGWFVIGATHFHRFYLGMAGPWDSVRETAYQQLFDKLRAAPADLATRSAEERERWADAARTFETLQFARLCHFIGDRPFDDFIGGSLLAFRLTDGEVQQALYGAVRPLRPVDTPAAVNRP